MPKKRKAGNRFCSEILLAHWGCFRLTWLDNTELKQRRQRRKRERQKSNRFRLAKQQLCTCITLFCTFFCRHCTSTTTWKCVVSRFVEDANTRQRLPFSFPELQYGLLKFNSRENCQHLTNWTRWNKRDKVWSSATSLLKWRFRSRRRPCCLSSLMLHQGYVYDIRDTSCPGTATIPDRAFVNT